MPQVLGDIPYLIQADGSLTTQAMTGSMQRLIYVIDDDDVVRDSLRALLEVRGYAVRDFDSGDRFFSEAPDLSRCCLIVDIHMPGMTGLDVVGALRARGEKVPAVLITGRRDAQIDAVAAGLDHAVLLDKPIAHGRLFAAIDEMLSGR
jgi:FixJ family two-component response regulator